MEFEHNIDWINAKILKMENNHSKRLVSEAWFINSRPNVMNRSDGDKLPQVYHIIVLAILMPNCFFFTVFVPLRLLIHSI